MDDIFSHIFGGGLFGFMGNQSRSRNGRRRGEDMMYPLKVSLEDLYNGKTTKLQLSENVLCSACSGQGRKSGAVQKCSACRGRGVRIMIRQLAPGMVQQMQSVCSDCNGEGEVINEKDRCKKCEGKKLIKEVKILEVHVDKGMKHGQRITFMVKQTRPQEWNQETLFFCYRRKNMRCSREMGMIFTRHVR